MTAIYDASKGFGFTIQSPVLIPELDAVAKEEESLPENDLLMAPNFIKANGIISKTIKELALSLTKKVKGMTELEIIQYISVHALSSIFLMCKHLKEEPAKPFSEVLDAVDNIVHAHEEVCK